MQTGIAQKVTSALRDAVNGDVKVGSVQLHPFNAVTVKDVVILDRDPFTGSALGRADTLASVGRLSATLSPMTLLKKRSLHLDHVELEDVLFHLASEPDCTNLSRILRLGGGEDSEMSLDTLLTINRLSVKNGRFRLQNMDPDPYIPEHGIAYSDMDIVFDIRGHGISFSEGRFRAVVDRLDLKEKSGYEVYGASGSCAVGMGKTEIDNFRFSDNNGSDMFFRKVIMSYENTSAWSSFVEKVDLDILFGPSHLVLNSIHNYGGSTFYGCPAVADIQEGRMKGPVADFRIENLVFTNPNGLSAAADGYCRGIPRMSTADLGIDIKEIKFTTAALDGLLSDFGSHTTLKKFAPGAVFSLNGHASGKLSDFTASATVNSALGRVRLNAKSKDLTTSDRDAVIAAEATATAFDLGRFLVTESLGKCGLDAEGLIRFGHGTFSVTNARADISSLNALGHEYRDVKLSGNMRNDAIDAILHSDDPDAPLDLDASVDLKHESGRVVAELHDVDLARLNLDKRGGASRVSCRLIGEQGFEKDAPMQVHISDLRLTNNEGTHRIGDIDAEARMLDDRLTLALNSECLDAKYDGTGNFASLVKYVRSISSDRALPEFFQVDPNAEAPEPLDATFSANFHDTEGLLAFIMPGLSISRGTAVNIDIDREGHILGFISSGALAFNGFSANELYVALDNQDNALSFSVNSDLLKINNISFSNASAGVLARNNRALLSVNYEGNDLLGQGSELYVDSFLTRDEKGRPAIDLSTLYSILHVKDDTWELKPSDIKLRADAFTVDGFRLASDTQSISVNGVITRLNIDTLKVELADVDVAVLNDFLSPETPKFGGIISGDANLLSPVPDEMGLWADLALSGFNIDGHDAGDLKLRGDWDDIDRRIKLLLTQDNGGARALTLDGWYSMQDKQVTAVATLDGLQIDVAAPFVKNYITGLDGRLKGKISAKGPLNALRLKSDDLTLNKVRGKVTYTNVAYTFDGSASVDDEGVHFNGVGIKDEYGGLGVLNGSLGFHELKDFRLDAALDMMRLKAIDIPTVGSGRLGYVYGDLAISGTSSISGPFNALHVDADIVTAGTGNVNVPIPESSTAQGSDLLTFTAPAADTLAVAAPEEEETVHTPSRFTAHAKVVLLPDVTASVEIDKDSGHVLTAGGMGSVVLDLNTAKSLLQLKGDYSISKGKYLFNIPGIVSKEFDIKEGSSIKFNGPVMESSLDISAVHNVKTSLATLIPADSTSVSSRRNVECGIKIDGRLKSPEISFSIDVPDLDPNTKMNVDNVLSTEDKIQKQFVALLLLGTFVPEGGSGVVNGTNMIISNVGEIVSSQLNNILQKLDIPLDFGIGYQQDQVGTDIFDVAVSTQLFNNRVLVNGSVGNRKYSTSKSAGGDVVGDLDVEVKMDRSGDLRFKLFSHSADEYSSSLDFTQRNGMGLSYQKEFNTFKDLIYQLFTSRKRKQREALIESGLKKEMKTILIEGE